MTELSPFLSQGINHVSILPLHREFIAYHHPDPDPVQTVLGEGSRPVVEQGIHLVEEGTGNSEGGRREEGREGHLEEGMGDRLALGDRLGRVGEACRVRLVLGFLLV